MIKIQTKNLSKTLNFIKKKVSKIIPDIPLTMKFLDDDLNKLYEILENEILPLYYNDHDTWRQIMKNGMRDVQFQFDSNRMVNEYYEILYA